MRLCLSCRFFYINEGSPRYSEWTPGWDCEIGCLKGHWELDNYNCSAGTYRRHNESAVKCPDYKHYKERE